MTSQFNQRMKARKVAGLRARAMESLTKDEEIFFGYRSIPFRGRMPTEDMEAIAQRERSKPTQWWHFLARIQELLLHTQHRPQLSAYEQDLIRTMRRRGRGVHSAVNAICAARRLGL